MLLYIFFIRCISIAGANYNPFHTFLDDFPFGNENLTDNLRFPRQVKRQDDFDVKPFSCKNLWHTSRTPFVVMILYKTSGRFLGMGSILDRKTILTASSVVEHTLHSPQDLFVVAGRTSPWWGNRAQVKKVNEIIINDEGGLALMNLKRSLDFTKYVAPIKIPLRDSPTITADYEKHLVVFGIPRSSWDVPGDLVPKTSVYLMKVELLVDETETCVSKFPDLELNSSVVICTTANGTYCWGCIGSPTVALDKNNKLRQIAVVTKTTTSDEDLYHIHTKIAPFNRWFRSHNLIGFDPKS